MILGPGSKEKVCEWREIHNRYRNVLTPNRKSGAEVLAYLHRRYVLEELYDEKALLVISETVLNNTFHKQKLPPNSQPKPKAFILKNEGNGTVLYENQEDIWGNCPIFVGVDLTSGYVQVEGSCFLHDEIYAFQGVDAYDIENCVRVADYVDCLQKFNPKLYTNLAMKG